MIPIRYRYQLLFCLILFALYGCEAKPIVEGPTRTSPLAASPSRTPFQPVSSLTSLLTPGQTLATPTITPPSTGTPARLFATLQITPASTQIPLPADILIEPAGEINILVLGSTPQSSENYSTNIIILLTLRPDKTIHLTSFPRDLYVYIPGWSMQRISAAQAHGGFALTASTFDYNFGFKPDYYVMTDLSIFPSLINTLGGIDVQVAQPFHASRSGYPNGYSVPSGVVHMDGATALWYSSVNTATINSDRMRRSQEVLAAMGQKLLTMNTLVNLPTIYNELHQNVTTNLNLNAAVNILPTLELANSNKVNRYSIADNQVIPWVEPNSQEHYLLPKPEAIRQLLEQAIGNP